MFAIIEVGNQQFRVEKDTIIETELTGHDVGSTFDIDKVLYTEKDGVVEIGKPYLGTNVKAEVLAEKKDKKIDGFIYKRRKGYSKQWGHRQRKHRVKILSI